MRAKRVEAANNKALENQVKKNEAVEIQIKEKQNAKGTFDFIFIYSYKTMMSISILYCVKYLIYICFSSLHHPDDKAVDLLIKRPLPHLLKRQERKTRGAKIAKEREENNALEREKQDAKGISLYILLYAHCIS